MSGGRHVLNFLSALCRFTKWAFWRSLQVPKAYCGKCKNRRIVAALNLCVLLLAIACKNTEPPVGETAGHDAEPVDAVPTQKLELFSTQHTEAGILKWTLVGDTSIFHGPYVQVEKPTVEIFENGTVSITLTSQTGKQFLTGSEKDNLHLFGDVVGISKDGKLFTDELHWRNRAGTLYAPNQVTLVRGDSTWVGIEMYANPTLETVEMKNNRFKLYPKDEKAHELPKPPNNSQNQ